MEGVDKFLLQGSESAAEEILAVNSQPLHVEDGNLAMAKFDQSLDSTTPSCLPKESLLNRNSLQWRI